MPRLFQKLWTIRPSLPWKLMLANDLVVNCESKWIFYDEEEAEILIEVSEGIYR
jgi:hypothetical protein